MIVVVVVVVVIVTGDGCGLYDQICPAMWVSLKLRPPLGNIVVIDVIVIGGVCCCCYLLLFVVVIVVGCCCCCCYSRELVLIVGIVEAVDIVAAKGCGCCDWAVFLKDGLLCRLCIIP